jgi:hypothetical protein
MAEIETTNQQILNETVNQQIRIERSAENQRRRITRLVLELTNEVESLIRSGQSDPTAVSTVSAQRRRIDRLIERIENLVEQHLLGQNGIRESLADNIVEMTDIETRNNLEIINIAIGVDLLRQSLPRARIEEIAEDSIFPSGSARPNPSEFHGNSHDWMFNIRDSFGRRLRSAWLGSLANGPTLNDLLFILRGSRQGRIGPRSVAGLTASQIQALYRTWQSSVHNQARIELYQSNSDFLKSIRDVATFDDRTARISIARHGNRYSLPDLTPIRRLDGRMSHPYLGGMPYHIGERNFYTPETRRISEIESSDRDHIRRRISELNDSQRRALNGEIPDNTTFDAFLRRQDETRQREILGNGAFKLWKDGKLSLRDLINTTTGTPLTVAELREKYGENIASDLR